MARLWLRKTDDGFGPADKSSQQAMRNFGIDGVFRADVVKPRSYQHHKLAFALLNMTYENQDRYTSFDMFRKAVAIAAGHVDELITLDGEVVMQPKSISYDALDEVQFGEVMAQMMTVCAEILYRVRMADLDDEARQDRLAELEHELMRYRDEHYGH